MSGSYLPIPEPKQNTTTFNSVKGPQVTSIRNDTVLVRFFEYHEKKCGIDQLKEGQLKTFINLIKEITKNPIGCQYNSCTWGYIDFTKTDEYTALMGKYKDTESVVEFYIGSTGRIFGFFLGANNEIPPTFNIFLITSEKHMETKKHKK